MERFRERCRARGPSERIKFAFRPSSGRDPASSPQARAPSGATRESGRRPGLSLWTSPLDLSVSSRAALDTPGVDFRTLDSSVISQKKLAPFSAGRAFRISGLFFCPQQSFWQVPEASREERRHRAAGARDASPEDLLHPSRWAARPATTSGSRTFLRITSTRREVPSGNTFPFCNSTARRKPSRLQPNTGTGRPKNWGFPSSPPVVLTRRRPERRCLRPTIGWGLEGWD